MKPRRDNSGGRWARSGDALRGGRDLLGTRLLRRGVAPAAVLLALSLLSKTSAAVSLRLIEAAARAATHVAAGEIVPRGEVPAGVVNLERKVRMAMHLTGLKWTTVIALDFILAGRRG